MLVIKSIQRFQKIKVSVFENGLKT